MKTISLFLLLVVLSFQSFGNEIYKYGYSNENSNTSTKLAEVVSDAANTADTVRILAIGNSFSRDAIEQNLYELAEAEGIPVIIGNLYIGGCSLERHLSNAKNNIPSYQYRKICKGHKQTKMDVTLAEGIADEKWDYISLQQVSGNSGRFKTWKKSLPALVKYVKEHAMNKEVELILHQTWAYASNSTHKAFKNYDNDQMKMYIDIVKAVNRAADLVDINIIIPSGTAIQNGRTTIIGDNFNRDGYHLELTYGRYTAACTWFEKIFDKNVVGNSYAPTGLDSIQIAIAQNAAHAAVLNPNGVTVLNEYLKMSQNKTIKILFIGNSYTYYNGVPSMISAMALRNDKNVLVSQITRGGNLLDQYAKSEFVFETINKFDFDFVVLQEHSTAPLFAAKERTYPAIRKLDSLIRENGGQVVLFMPWAREYADSITIKMLPGKFYYDVFDSYNTAQDSLASSYFRIGNEINAKVAPAGLIWKEFHARYPKVPLWRTDHSHPLEIGSVLAAYAIYKTIFDEPAKSVRCPIPVSKTLVNAIEQITDELIPN